jgi:hypothetical protein
MLLFLSFQIYNYVHSKYRFWKSSIIRQEKPTCKLTETCIDDHSTINNVNKPLSDNDSSNIVYECDEADREVGYTTVQTTRITYDKDSNNNIATEKLTTEAKINRKDAKDNHFLGIPDYPVAISDRQKKRQLHVLELFETEERYLDTLIMVKVRFRDSLTSMSGLDKMIIFSQLDEIIILHSDLLHDLNSGTHDNIAHIFNKHLPRLSILYTKYCINIPMALEKLQNFEEVRKNSKMLRDCQAGTHLPGLPLSAHLSVPFQRFLKYHLLLKNILSNTETEDAENNKSDQLSKTVEAILAIQTKVNCQMIEHEETEKQTATDIEGMWVLVFCKQFTAFLE